MIYLPCKTEMMRLFNAYFSFFFYFYFYVKEGTLYA